MNILADKFLRKEGLKMKITKEDVLKIEHEDDNA